MCVFDSESHPARRLLRLALNSWQSPCLFLVRLVYRLTCTLKTHSLEMPSWEKQGQTAHFWWHALSPGGSHCLSACEGEAYRAKEHAGLQRAQEHHALEPASKTKCWPLVLTRGDVDTNVCKKLAHPSMERQKMHSEYLGNSLLPTHNEQW